MIALMCIMNCIYDPFLSSFFSPSSSIPGGMMSVFLMGVYDKSRDKFCTVAKCGNGHDDATLSRLQKELDMVKISKVQHMKCSANEMDTFMIVYIVCT